MALGATWGPKRRRTPASGWLDRIGSQRKVSPVASKREQNLLRARARISSIQFRANDVLQDLEHCVDQHPDRSRVDVPAVVLLQHAGTAGARCGVKVGLTGIEPQLKQPGDQVAPMHFGPKAQLVSLEFA